jgi:hypothetical protein
MYFASIGSTWNSKKALRKIVAAYIRIASSRPYIRPDAQMAGAREAAVIVAAWSRRCRDDGA